MALARAQEVSSSAGLMSEIRLCGFHTADWRHASPLEGIRHQGSKKAPAI